ncbi:MAG: bile acid:sodium symporter family protein [Candidatus Phlomobacter fragariae]
MSWWRRLQIDYFLLLMLMTIMIASFFPCQGKVKIVFQHLTTIAIALLFFLHGAKFSRQAILAGIGHWRLHLLIFTSTFILFPIINLVLKPLVLYWISPPTICIGFLYLCALPATVQSAIAFTSVADGNITAAICSASASSLLGMFLSPVLVSFLIDFDDNHIDLWKNIGAILLQIMLPFILGHLLRPLIIKWINRYRRLITISDRSSILFVVYVTFSEAVIEGIWHKVDGWSLLMIVIISCLLLAIVVLFNIYSARYFGFSKADEITIVFCGSKKSLVNGVPMANILFPAHLVGIILLPVMIFHQIQLMVCAVLAQHYAKRAVND